MSGPVTVSITRKVDPSQEDQMLAWLRAGFELAERFDGYLGIRLGAAVDRVQRVAHALPLRVAGVARGMGALAQRRWWLDSAQGFVAESAREHRTGIEGWFDEPSSVDVQDLRTVTPPPPRWKQMCAIFIVFFPLSLAANYVAKDFAADWWLPVRVFAITAVMTPLMTYLALPWITRLLHPWLNAARTR